jgi:hypothetical protein
MRAQRPPPARRSPPSAPCDGVVTDPWRRISVTNASSNAPRINGWPRLNVNQNSDSSRRSCSEIGGSVSTTARSSCRIEVFDSLTHRLLFARRRARRRASLPARRCLRAMFGGIHANHDGLRDRVEKALPLPRHGVGRCGRRDQLEAAVSDQMLRRGDETLGLSAPVRPRSRCCRRRGDRRNGAGPACRPCGAPVRRAPPRYAMPLRSSSRATAIIGLRAVRPGAADKDTPAGGSRTDARCAPGLPGA